ncbi:MAG: type I restriction enzyme HsdR N-terminal domain-containing protein [Bacteroidota bacterium]
MSVWLDIDLLQVQPFIKIRKKPQGNEIFDTVRKKWLILQPEEWVRQLMVLYLSKILHFPLNHFSIEKGVSKGLKKGRWDILIFDYSMKPFLLIECKSPNIYLTDDVIYQAAVYNIVLKAPYIAVTNGTNTSCFMIDKPNNGYNFLTAFPVYPIL